MIPLGILLLILFTYIIFKNLSNGKIKFLKDIPFGVFLISSWYIIFSLGTLIMVIVKTFTHAYSENNTDVINGTSSSGIVLDIIKDFVKIIVWGFFGVMLFKGKNWARIVVLFIIIFNFMNSIFFIIRFQKYIYIISVMVEIIFLIYLLFNKNTLNYFYKTNQQIQTTEK